MQETTSRKIKSAACLALICALAGFVSSASAADEISDPAVQLTAKLMKRAMAAAKNAPLKENGEAGEVVRALGSTRDAALIPLFARVRQSNSEDNQVFAMVTMAVLAKEANITLEGPNALDLKVLFATKDTVLQTSALGILINAKAISNAELKVVMDNGPEAIQRAMAAGELSARNVLFDRKSLPDMLKNDKPIVVYETALTMLDGKQPADHAAALEAVEKLAAKHDLRDIPVQALMLDRMEKEKLTAALPWAVQLAGDEAADAGLRFTAVGALLVMGAPDAPALLTELIQKQKDPVDQLKLGLMCIEHGAQIKKEALAPIAASKSSLAKAIAKVAQKAADKADFTPDLLDLMKAGDPIVLEWAFQYAERATPERRLAIRTALVNQATIVDNVRDRDYERAALAAERILEDDGTAGRKVVANLLLSENRAVVDATLSGIYRSSAPDQSELVLHIWNGLSKSTSLENSANYAALILGREGHKEAATWLPNMVNGGTAQGPGFRALAGWYNAKLVGQSDALLKAALADN